MSGGLRCACGKSKSYPLCDGSHVSERWACADLNDSSRQVFDVAFCCSRAYTNLALKLASEFDTVYIDASHPWLSSGGAAAAAASSGTPHSGSRGGRGRVRVLVSIVQGAVDDIPGLVLQLVRPLHRHVIYSLQPTVTQLSIAMQCRAPERSFCTIRDVSALELDISAMFVRIREDVSGMLKDVLPSLPDMEDMMKASETKREAEDPEEAVEEEEQKTKGVASTAPHLQSVFVSHAVKDEAMILPAVNGIRRMFASQQPEMFLCSDGIGPGQNWRDTIMQALRDSQVFVLMLSKATLASHFCSFEVGCAYGLRKCITIVSLDGSLPPAFISHVQILDVPRQLKQRPWLLQADVILEGLLQALTTTPATCDCLPLASSVEAAIAPGADAEVGTVRSARSAAIEAANRAASEGLRQRLRYGAVTEVDQRATSSTSSQPVRVHAAGMGEKVKEEEDEDKDGDEAMRQYLKHGGPSWCTVFLLVCVLLLCALPALVLVRSSKSSRPFSSELYEVLHWRMA